MSPKDGMKDGTKEEKKFTKWEEAKERNTRRLRQLDEAEANLRGQLEIIRENLDKIKMEKEGLLAMNQSGDLALRMFQEHLKELEEEQNRLGLYDDLR